MTLPTFGENPKAGSHQASECIEDNTKPRTVLINADPTEQQTFLEK